MKEIIYNYDCLKDEEINSEVLRAKLLIINSDEEILLGYGHNNYQIPGGHVEENETFDECVVREIQEETGIIIPLEKRKPFLVIKYLCKDYPSQGQNTKYIANYYSIKTDLKPNLSNVNLTENELEGMFELRYIHKDSIIEELNKSLETCTNKNVILDTLEVVKEYLNI
ncbi:MAG: NUDIX hydrolase [Bacilli bacterium]|nr:NUDIX hydrolase [Bacilli bacterium]